MIGKGQTAGACDHRMDSQVSKLLIGILQEGRKGLPDVGKVPFVIRKQDLVRFI